MKVPLTNKTADNVKSVLSTPSKSVLAQSVQTPKQRPETKGRSSSTNACGLTGEEIPAQFTTITTPDKKIEIKITCISPSVNTVQYQPEIDSDHSLGCAPLSRTVVENEVNEVGEVRLRERMACLLYTSPSPRDKRQSRMPSSA